MSFNIKLKSFIFIYRITQNKETIMSNQSIATTSPQRLSMAAWYLVREYAGIYGVKMDYSAVKGLKPRIIYQAYFDIANLPPISRTNTHCNKNDMLITCGNGRGAIRDYLSHTKPRCKTVSWEVSILKQAAMGYKNRDFYEALSRALNNNGVRKNTPKYNSK